MNDTLLNRLFSRRTLIVLLPLFLAGIALLVSYCIKSPASVSWLRGSHPSWIAGLAVVFIFLLVIPFLMSLPVRRLAYIDELIQGADNRPSTSKIQFLWWTVAVLFSYVALKVRLLQLSPGTELRIPPMLIVAMGAGALVAVGAKAIAVNQAKKGEGAPNAAPNKPSDGDGTTSGTAGDETARMAASRAVSEAAQSSSPSAGQAVSGQNTTQPIPPAGDLRYAVTDDSGKADLSKIQMLTWTVIAIALFLWRVSRMIVLPPTLSEGVKHWDLPDIDPALVVLTGLAQGMYLGRKLVPDTTPWLQQITPQEATAGSDPEVEVTITGKNFGAEQRGSMITFNETPITVKVNKWSAEEIKFLLPKNLPPNPKIHIGVEVGGQMSANALPFKIT